jgi:excisionase family DNA binding protein
MRENDPVGLWWLLGLVSIIALVDPHQVIDNRLRPTSSWTSQLVCSGPWQGCHGSESRKGRAVAVQRKGNAGVEPPSYLRTAEVADLLYVSPKTVSRWAKEGKLPFMETLGGHRRYPEAEIRELVGELREEPTA